MEAPGTVGAEKNKERLFEEARFKDRFGCVKIEAQILNHSQLLLKYSAEKKKKIGFEALGGTKLAHPWGFLCYSLQEEKRRKSLGSHV